MITQELIDYVKTQLSAGVAREQITSDLLGQGGWTMEQINEAFQAAQQSTPAHVPQQENVIEMTETFKKSKWNKTLPIASRASFIFPLLIFVCLIIALLVSATLNDAGGIRLFTPIEALYEIFFDFGPWGLAAFAWLMVGSLMLAYPFYWYERHRLTPRFENTESPLDIWILILIILRTIVMTLSVIPFIQLLGLVALLFGGIPYLIIYYFIVRSRSKSVVTV